MPSIEGLFAHYARAIYPSIEGLFALGIGAV